MDVPTEAIEAVTTACPYLTPEGARVALAAAMPAIREALAQEIEAIEVEWTKDANGYPVHYEMLDPREMRLVAARIVRGDTP